MSEEEKPPKKAARKRVVKKAARAPRKSASPKEEVASDTEVFSLAEEAQPKPKGRKPKQEPTLEVVQESPEIAKAVAEESGDGKAKGDASPIAEVTSDQGEDRNERGNQRKRSRNRRGGRRDDDDAPRNESKQREIDSDEAAEKAWAIYQGELEEEGVSLVDPRRARDLARRCLELAAVFCEERDRFLKK